MKKTSIERPLLLASALICASSFSLAPRACAMARKVPSLYEAADTGAAAAASTKNLNIRVVESDTDGKSKEVAWLGVSTEEASDALSSQLGLEPGDGLVVNFVEPDSPAAKAGLQKNDVLVELGDQLLVHPGQFRKLVRRQKEGDKVKLTLFRSGKKQSVSATLAKTTERVAGDLEGTGHEVQVQLADPKTLEMLREHLKEMRNTGPYTGLIKQVVNVDVQRGMEQARQAMSEALVHNRSFAQALGYDAKTLEELTKGNRAGNTTVTVKKNAKSIKTMVKADDNGTFVIVANPTKRLTVHDKDGKLLFDGEIETQEQQQKVPAELWQKAQEMLEEMGPVTEDDTASKEQPSENKKN